MLREALARLRRPLPKALAQVLTVVVVLAVYVVINRNHDFYSDEMFHHPSIVRVATGKYDLHPALTTIPGYHYVCGLLSRILRHHGLALVRFYSVLFGLVAVWAAAKLARSVRPPPGRFAVAQVLLLPLALPYFALCYTDVPSLAMVLVGIWLWLSNRRWEGALVLTLSMSMRQTNVAWLVFVLLYSVFSSGLFDYSSTHLARLLKKTWPALIGVFAFGAFVWFNGGIARGSTDTHSVQPAVGNLFFCLFAYFFMFLPTNLFVLWRNRNQLGDLRLCLLVAFAYALYRFGYRVDSPLNYIAGFVRNDILMYFSRDEALKNAFFVPVVLSLAVLYWTPLRTWGSYAVYPVAILLLLPATLIEHRYYIVPIALLTLLRSHEDDSVEILTATTCAALSGYFVYGIGLKGLNL